MSDYLGNKAGVTFNRDYNSFSWYDVIIVYIYIYHAGVIRQGIRYNNYFHWTFCLDNYNTKKKMSEQNTDNMSLSDKISHNIVFIVSSEIVILPHVYPLEY